VTIELLEIPGLDARQPTVWKVRALVVDGRNPVLAALVRWQREYPDDYKAIMKVMRLAALQKRVLNPKHVKKSADERHGNAYEMLAYTGIARLMFFYDEGTESLIICTNEFEKGGGDQSAAFQRCVTFRGLYLKAQKREQA
jgi:hypothetical protein